MKYDRLDYAGLNAINGTHHIAEAKEIGDYAERMRALQQARADLAHAMQLLADELDVQRRDHEQVVDR